ncbi:MAG: NUDIX hydrolase [Candidatus Paceibacterota bacterium]
MYRKGASALIIDKNNKFLLVNLESFEEKYFAVPGGGQDNNETLEEAIYREIKEELNISKKSLKLVGYSKAPLKIKFKKIKLKRDGKEYEGSERYFFGFRFIGDGEEIIPQENEVRKCEWVSIDDLKNYLLFDDQLENTLQKIKELFPFIIKGE